MSAKGPACTWDTMEAPPEAVLLLLHGFTCSSADLGEIVSSLRAHCPSVMVVTPDAPRIPITAHGGAHCSAWYDYVTEYQHDRQDLADEASLRLTTARLGALICRLRVEFPGALVCAAGVSQGGCVAVELAARGLVSAAFSMVAHPITAGGRGVLNRMKTSKAQWHGLLASGDSVIALDWALPLHDTAASVAIVEGDHWQSDRVLGAWLAERLEKYTRNVKSETSCLPVSSHP